MNINITVTNDTKGRAQGFEATAVFNYIWDNSWNGYSYPLSMTAFGSTEQEAQDLLREELYRFQNEFVKALSKLHAI